MTALANSQAEEVRIMNENRRAEYLGRMGVPALDCDERVKAPVDAEGLILRGRDDYNMTGVLRTKPGRVDAESTLSMSCRYVSC